MRPRRPDLPTRGHVLQRVHASAPTLICLSSCSRSRVSSVSNNGTIFAIHSREGGRAFQVLGHPPWGVDGPSAHGPTLLSTGYIDETYIFRVSGGKLAGAPRWRTTWRGCASSASRREGRPQRTGRELRSAPVGWAAGGGPAGWRPEAKASKTVRLMSASVVIVSIVRD